MAERPGDIVDPVPVSVAATAIGFDVSTPTTPGRYRLAITLHDPSGVAYDAGTQSLVPGLLVRVTGELDAAIVVAGPTEATVGAVTTLPLWVTNLGREAWGHLATPERAGRVGGPATAARVVGQWLAIGADDAGQREAAAAATASADLPPGHEPGTTVQVDLAMTVPDRPRGVPARARCRDPGRWLPRRRRSRPDRGADDGQRAGAAEPAAVARSVASARAFARSSAR